MAVEAARQLIDAVTFGDGGEIKGQRRPFAHATVLAVEVEEVTCRPPRLAGQDLDPRFVDVSVGGAETPGLDQITDADVKRAVRLPADAHGSLEDIEQGMRDAQPCMDGCAVQAIEIGVCLPARHLPVHRIRRRRQAHCNGRFIHCGGGVKDGAVAAAHGRAMQAVALPGCGRCLRRIQIRLHDSALAV